MPVVWYRMSAHLKYSGMLDVWERSRLHGNYNSQTQTLIQYPDKERVAERSIFPSERIVAKGGFMWEHIQTAKECTNQSGYCSFSPMPDSSLPLVLDVYINRVEKVWRNKSNENVQCRSYVVNHHGITTFWFAWFWISFNVALVLHSINIFFFKLIFSRVCENIRVDTGLGLV